VQGSHNFEEVTSAKRTDDPLSKWEQEISTAIEEPRHLNRAPAAITVHRLKAHFDAAELVEKAHTSYADKRIKRENSSSAKEGELDNF